MKVKRQELAWNNRKKAILSTAWKMKQESAPDPEGWDCKAGDMGLHPKR